MKKDSTYTAYAVRNVNRRQYLNEGSPRGGRWDRLGNASIFFKESEAAARCLDYNLSAGKDTTQVVPIRFFKRG